MVKLPGTFTVADSDLELTGIRPRSLVALGNGLLRHSANCSPLLLE